MGYSSRKVAGTLFFIATTQFILVVIVAEALNQDYSISYNYISDLGVGPYSFIFNASIFLFGLLLLIGSFFLQRASYPKVPTGVIALMGIGAMLVGVFPEQAVHIPGTAHFVAGSIFQLFGVLSALMSHRLLKMPLSAINLVLGLFSLVAYIIFGLIFFDNRITIGIGEGGIQRMVIYPFLIALAVVGIYVMSLEKNHPSNNA